MSLNREDQRPERTLFVSSQFPSVFNFSHNNPRPSSSSFHLYNIIVATRSLVLLLSFNMWSKLLALTAATLFAFYSTALGQTNFTTNWNPTGEGCVDSTGYVSCYNDRRNTGISCQTACASNNKKGTTEYNTCMDACEALWLAGNVGCWLQSCWNQVCFMPNPPSSANPMDNKVYSCAYQLTAMSYFDGAGLEQNSDIPFYPPPNDASAGACCELWAHPRNKYSTS